MNTLISDEKIFNKHLKNTYQFVTINLSANQNLKEIKQILLEEIELNLDSEKDRTFKLTIFPKNQIMVYLLSTGESVLDLEEFVELVCSSNEIGIKNISKMSLNPLN